MSRTLVIAFLATLATALVLANDLNIGGPEANDHLVKRAVVIRKPRYDTQRAIVVFSDGSKITSIRAVDHNVTNNATVVVAAGGIGERVAVLYFKAPRRRGMNFTVEVRGVHPPKPTPPPKPTTTPRPPKPTTTPRPPKPTTTPSPSSTTEPPAESTTESEPPAETTTESEPPAESTTAEEEVEENEEEVRLLNQVYYANRLF